MKLIQKYGEDNVAEIGEYTISRDTSGHIDTYQAYGNTKRILLHIASELGMPIKDRWNTRILGNKVIDFIEGNFNPDTEIEEEGFVITPQMTTFELFNAFTKEFGGHLRIKKGVKRCDPNISNYLPEMPLSEIGMTDSVTLNGDMTVGEAKKLAASKGLKFEIGTNDDWVVALDEFPIDSVKLIPNSTTKNKMREILDR